MLTKIVTVSHRLVVGLKLAISQSYIVLEGRQSLFKWHFGVLLMLHSYRSYLCIYVPLNTTFYLTL